MPFIRVRSVGETSHEGLVHRFSYMCGPMRLGLKASEASAHQVGVRLSRDAIELFNVFLSLIAESTDLVDPAAWMARL